VVAIVATARAAAVKKKALPSNKLLAPALGPGCLETPMASFNKVILMGNLTRDPQLKYLPSQMPVVEFGLACSRKWKSPNGEEREDVLFVDCSAFSKTAELINQYFTKGKPIFIEGRLKYDSWEDKQGGGKRSRLTVVVENFQFIGGRDGASGGGGNQGGDDMGQAAPAQRPAARPPQQRPAQEPPFTQEENFKSDDIPF
jgi:single-strand DNA-binding protein